MRKPLQCRIALEKREPLRDYKDPLFKFGYAFSIFSGAKARVDFAA
jgi:hypothetical protein